uniref:Transposase n=1 Tax=Anisakis simplex TaxID=6269 RepID=A0A0M3JPE3_ANISI
LSDEMDSNMAALIGYANDRARIYHRLNDRISFFNELDQVCSILKIIPPCFPTRFETWKLWKTGSFS